MGVRVILGSRDVDAGTEAAKTMGGNVVAAALDLSDKEVVASQVAAINSDLGAMT
jgi:NADP-dependent 3-hydroxy acid dehydrogenase YdfG